MVKLKELSFNTYKYEMNFKKEYIEKYKLDLLTILYLSSINILRKDNDEKINLVQRIKKTFLYLDVLINYKDTRHEEDKDRFKEALFDELNALKDLYLDFSMEDIDMEDFNEWLAEQK